MNNVDFVVVIRIIFLSYKKKKCQYRTILLKLAATCEEIQQIWQVLHKFAPAVMVRISLRIVNPTITLMDLSKRHRVSRKLFF